MSTAAIIDSQPRSASGAVSGAEHEPRERSPLVAVAVAMAVAGGILASSDPGGVRWLLLFFCVWAVEEEVRRFEVPNRLSAVALMAQFASVVYAADFVLLVESVGGAILIPSLLFPFCALGLVRTSALSAGAAIGAIVGFHTMPTLLLLAAGLAIPIAVIRVLNDRSVSALPLVSLIAIVAAIHPLL